MANDASTDVLRCGEQAHPKEIALTFFYWNLGTVNMPLIDPYLTQGGWHRESVKVKFPSNVPVIVPPTSPYSVILTWPG